MLCPLQVAFSEPLVHLEDESDEAVEGGRAVPHEEVFKLLGETPLIGAPEGIVIPPTVGSQGPELERVFSYAPGSLLDLL